MPPVISFRNAAKDFRVGKNVITAVDSVDLDVERGEVVGVIGYSGAGKSTLVRLINGLETPSRGTVVVDGKEVAGLTERELRRLRAQVGMIFQQFNLLNSRTAAGNVAYPLKVAGWPRERRAARVAELLEFVGIADQARQYPNQLSGGQKQRVGIARALATDPTILLADEATSALDPETTRDVLALLKKINTELGTTVVVITHEMDVVSSICDKVAVMENGRVIEHGPIYDVFARPREPATRRFVHSVLRDRPPPETLRRLRHSFPGRIVTVAVRDDGASQATLARKLGEHNVRSTIIYGGIGELAEKPFGSITYELVGEDASVDALIAELDQLASVEELP
ncbi:methionine ABC transporter ATP-binding protein [Pseudonocardia acaciae]|uniref:methionine ABC transporter ATP-binding protein n=1 Tax=Pseudonocardia acaciae TaxID=551276 RepID=UPI00048A95D2|nr:ATP-binding cassette domain-containing protein [Pseudonocardia acaciae]